MKRRISLLLAVVMTAATVAAASVDINAAETGNDASAGQTVVEETNEEQGTEPAETVEEPVEPQAEEEPEEKVEEAEAADTGTEETVTEPEESVTETEENIEETTEEITEETDEAAIAATEAAAEEDEALAEEEINLDELDALMAAKVTAEGWYSTGKGFSRYYYKNSSGNFVYAKNQFFETGKDAWHYFDNYGRSYHKVATYYNNSKSVTVTGHVSGKKVTFGKGRIYFNDNGLIYLNGVNTDKNGYVYKNGSWMFIYPKTNVAASGWCLMNNGWHYFDPTTNLTVLGNSQGWKSISAAYKGTQTSPNGSLKETVNIKAGTHHFSKTGVLARSCWRKIDNMSFYFDEFGIQYSGWHLMEGGWYYFSKNGTYKGWHKTTKAVTKTDTNPKTGKKETITVAAGSHYFTDKGVYVYNKWYTVNGCKFFFKLNGLQALGWWKLGKSTWYITKAKGALKGMQTIDKKKYLFDTSTGVMKTGWQQYKGDWYYFNASGVMQAGKTVDGVYLGKDGKADVTGTKMSMIIKAQKYSSGTGYLALVNKDAHRVAIFKGSKGNWKLIRYMTCSVGAWQGGHSRTPSGEFTTRFRSYSVNFAHSTCFYCTFVSGGFYFHSVLYDKYSSAPHSWNVLDGSMGVHVSHSCVRLGLDNTKWVYYNMPLYTKVVAYGR